MADLGILPNSVPPHIGGKPYGVYKDKLCSYVHDLRNLGVSGPQRKEFRVSPVPQEEVTLGRIWHNEQIAATIRLHEPGPWRSQFCSAAARGLWGYMGVECGLRPRGRSK